ncbi:MAG TPA: hypothetical protein VFB52_01490 [Solirubrobacterales bacterium]|nr:hypothetical protein [Solirubrobacterales bacterium]
MGILGRIKDGVVTKLDGPPKPPPHVWPDEQPWARLLSSERNPGAIGDPNQDGAPSMLDDLIGKAAGVPYGFELEVHRPDRPTYTLARRQRVPSKVEGILFLRSHSIPAGAEVPIRVSGPNPEDIELDWDAYLAIPDQSARAYHLRIEQSRAMQQRENG